MADSLFALKEQKEMYSKFLEHVNSKNSEFEKGLIDEIAKLSDNLIAWRMQ